MTHGTRQFGNSLARWLALTRESPLVTTARDLTASPDEIVPPGLDPLVKRLFVGIAFSALGSGLTMPFLYVYLAEVRGI